MGRLMRQRNDGEELPRGHERWNGHGNSPVGNVAEPLEIWISAELVF